MIRVQTNLNYHIYVKLTDNGRAILKQEGIQQLYQPDADGWVKIPMWEFAQVFGNRLWLGNPHPPVEMTVRMEVGA